jgi:hypothetical protein
MDLLSECMSMVVASKISKGVQMEIDYCQLWNMPIRYLNAEKGTTKRGIFKKS